MFNSLNLLRLVFFIPMTIGLSLSVSTNKIEETKTYEPQPAVIATTTKTVDQKQLQCLADNIFFEAGGEPIEGQAAVARVVLNRVAHGYGNTPCKVVYQSNTIQQINQETEETFWVKVCQFHWVCEGKKNPNRNSPRYQKSLQVATDVLLYDKYKEVIPVTVLFFHNLTVHPNWPYQFAKKIGNHIFYSKPPRKKRR